jgi:hypothetical protein
MLVKSVDVTDLIIRFYFSSIELRNKAAQMCQQTRWLQELTINRSIVSERFLRS